MHYEGNRRRFTHRPLILAGALLALLAAYGCERPPGASRPTAPSGPARSTEADPPAAASQRAAASQPAEPAHRFIAYYFHRTIRCPTCLSIEKQSREAIESAYAGELHEGRLKWHAINIEEPGNEHFALDFELQSQSLVLVEMKGAQVARWKLLPKVWELVEDPNGFQQYVVTEVAVFLAGG
jgi:hypothetical protein